jgi:pimeloyl-ACP methyl ester carboxylesterase
MLEPEILYFDVPDGLDSTKKQRIACAQWGVAGEKPTLLCVHGLTRNGRDFDFVADALAKHFHVLAPDMRGRGQSAWAGDAASYNNVTYLTDIGFILLSLGVQKVHWLGTSMGGILAMMAASGTPNLIQSLILNDIGCFLPATGLQKIRDIATIATVFSSRDEAEEAVRMRCSGFGISEEVHWQHLYAHGLQRTEEGWRFAYDPAIFSVGYSADTPIADINLWGLFPGFSSIPTFLLRGMQSELLTHSTAVEMQEKHSKLTLHEFENVGHAPSLMDDKHVALIREWMSAIV